MSDQFDAKAFLKTVTSQPGVYRMYDAGGTVIYVGKAKDLKKRLSSYFRSNLASRKTEALVAQIQQIDVRLLIQKPKRCYWNTTTSNFISRVTTFCYAMINHILLSS